MLTEEFLRLFENYVVATYSDRLSSYLDGSVVLRVIGSRPNPDGAIVSSLFNLGSGSGRAGAISVDWRLTERDRVCDPGLRDRPGNRHFLPRRRAVATIPRCAHWPVSAEIDLQLKHRGFLSPRLSAPVPRR
jgi:hypothetical protein